MADDDPASDFGVLRWFSSDGEGDSGPNGWRLDVVTLLAVIGESSIAEHSQAITASILCLFPRIIPAPQALLKGSRPLRMPETTAKMTGVYSGVVLDTVGFFANIIHPLDEFQPFAFKMIRITHVDRNAAGGITVPPTAANGNNKMGLTKLVTRGGRTNTGTSNPRSPRIPGPPPNDREETETELRARTTGLNFNADVEAQSPTQGIRRRETIKDRVTDYVSNPTLATNAKRPAVPPALYSPIHILSIFSVVLTAAIIGWAAYINDGTAILAVFLVSLASSVVGVASWWRPILMNRSHTNKVPEGDVVIRTREGAFILVKCTEEVARELYAGTEECEYRVGPRVYSALMGVGTLLLMVSVILLGNCKWYSQIFISAAYISLNGLYWCMGLLPKRYFWDLSRYKCEDITPEISRQAHDTTDEGDPREGVKSFTRTLWYVIRETKRTAWVERSGASPSTPQWKAWLAEAEQAAREGNMRWPAVARKDALMKMTESELNDLKSPVPSEVPLDPAEQAAPAIEVQPKSQPREVGAL